MSNSIWITGLICLIIGLIIGVIVGRLKPAKNSAGKANNTAGQHTELSQLHEQVENHFAQITRIASELQSCTTSLNRTLEEDAGHLIKDESIKRRLSVLAGSRSAEEVADEEAASLSAPRDYAEEKGTLTEGFGIHKSTETPESEPVKADRPRY
ncbi:hypothetical protein LMG33818_000597 [Halomonadaceae bacterium LMG 33818]|uniref:ZapG family protein n=1 Tax=Cernens ardua TaxID=3402176 RepID=UPI003EDCAC14